VEANLERLRDLPADPIEVIEAPAPPLPH